MKRVPLLALGWAALVGVLVGHSRARAQAPLASPPPKEERPGLVLLVEGIGGLHLMHVSGNVGFWKAGLPHEVRQFYWSHGLGSFLKDLQDIRHTIAKGEELAAEIQALKKKDPDRRIFIVAHSGGTGIAACAAEKLPPGTIERMVFLSSALSPQYDLRPALAATQKGIVSYYSPNDKFFLEWGTTNFGTIDRCYGTSAGNGGFAVPADLSPADRALYERLVQVPWGPRMLLQGNCGTHAGTVLPTFLGGEVAKWLR